MKPAARIQSIIEVLEHISIAPVPMDSCIGDYMRKRRYIGSKDRVYVVERAYGVMRAHARLGWWLKRSGLDDSPRMRVIAYLVLVEEADEKRLADLFDGTQYAPQPIDEEEHSFIKKILGKNLLHPDMPESVQVECPPDYEEPLRNYFGADFKTEMEALLEPAPLDLRVNVFAVPRENAKKSLEKDGVETTETPYSPWGLRCKEKAYLSKTKAFAKGWVAIQDEGSQLIAYICGAQPGMQVLDYCAGGGGKTLALAAAMERKGRIVAMDIDARRLEKGKQRYKKSGLADIIEVRPLSEEKQRKWFKRQKEKFDVVLVDAPCSGTGTWRRNPDLRWRQFGPGLEELVAVQAEILDKVAGCVKPGGRLVYATCSLLAGENEKQVEAFLERHPNFTVIPSEAEGSGQILPCAALGRDDEGPYMRLTPQRHSTDGFFAAIMHKT